MNKQTVEQNLEEVHQIYAQMQARLNTLHVGITKDVPERVELDAFLDAMKLEKNKETRFAASQRLGNWKFEPLQIYLQEQGKTQSEQDEVFESSYIYTQKYIQELQQYMVDAIAEKKLLPDFYIMLLQETHEL